MAIKRVWRGWTTKGNADTYQQVLLEEVIPGIEAKQIEGLKKFEVLRLDHAHEVEFMTMMTFESLAQVIALQGQDYTKAYVPEAAQKVLKRWDLELPHYELIETKTYN